MFIHRNAHVIERTDDPFDRIRIDDIVGQMVVDFGIGEKRTLLAQLDQYFQPFTATLQFFFRCLRIACQRILQQRLFLGLAILRTSLVGRFQFSAFHRIQCGHFLVFRLEILGLAATASRYLHGGQHIAGSIDRRQPCRIGCDNRIGYVAFPGNGCNRFLASRRQFGFSAA